MEITPGRTGGQVDVPVVNPNLPRMTDEQVEEAITELGLTSISLRGLRSVRTLGQFAREAGAISTARGLVLAGYAQALKIGNRAAELEKVYDDPELKEKFLRLAGNCADSVINAGKVILDSETRRTNSSDMPISEPEQLPRLPQFGETVMPVQVNGNLEIHNHG